MLEFIKEQDAQREEKALLEHTLASLSTSKLKIEYAKEEARKCRELADTLPDTKVVHAGNMSMKTYMRKCAEAIEKNPEGFVEEHLAKCTSKLLTLSKELKKGATLER